MDENDVEIEDESTSEVNFEEDTENLDEVSVENETETETETTSEENTETVSTVEIVSLPSEFTDELFLRFDAVSDMLSFCGFMLFVSLVLTACVSWLRSNR